MYVAYLQMITILTISIVYRISWLRAKARYTRWEEELSLVKHEMTWTVAWFEELVTLSHRSWWTPPGVQINSMYNPWSAQ